MRLLHASKWQMAEFISDDATPRYAILSHTWGLNEVTYQDWRNLPVSEASLQEGCAKILVCREQAVRDGLEWVWVDTCCIDKSSSAELTEAINSMFRWYKNAHVCYVLLSDVSATPDQAVLEERMSKSRWFARGWTLQELLAPAPEKLIFYSKEWIPLGSKVRFADMVSSITGIGKTYLHGQDLRHASVAQKMSWAALRQTSRLEDVAYCLLGLFDINMPMIYGEGNRAFIRLQEAIMMSTPDDHSLFAWGQILEEHDAVSRFPTNSDLCAKEPLRHESIACEQELFGLLAVSPKDFEHSGKIVPSREAAQFYKRLDNPNIPTKIGRDTFRLDLPMLLQNLHSFYYWKELNIVQARPLIFAALLCHLEGDLSSSSCVVLPLLWNGGWTMSRTRTLYYQREQDIILSSVVKKRTVYVAPEIHVQPRFGDVVFRRLLCASPYRRVGYTIAGDSWYYWDGGIGVLSSSNSRHIYGTLLAHRYKMAEKDDRGVVIGFNRSSATEQLSIKITPVIFTGRRHVESDGLTWYPVDGLSQATPLFSRSMALPSDEWVTKTNPLPEVYVRTERVVLDASGLFVDVIDLLVGFGIHSG